MKLNRYYSYYENLLENYITNIINSKKRISTEEKKIKS